MSCGEFEGALSVFFDSFRAWLCTDLGTNRYKILP